MTTTASPILTPAQLHAIARQVLDLSTASTVEITLSHVADGIARIMNNRVRLNATGDLLDMTIKTKFGGRLSMTLQTNQTDTDSLRRAVRYLERVAHDLPGDETPDNMPVRPKQYLPATTWCDATAAAFSDARHRAVPALVAPIRQAGFTGVAYVGVHLKSVAHLDRDGNAYAGQESDSEIVATGWSADEKAMGWAGQTSRDWTTLDPAAVSKEAARLTRLALNPVAFEPGRYTAILGRPAVAQLVRSMGIQFDARTVWDHGPLHDTVTRRPRLGQRVLDPRISMSSDPNDPVASYLPFNWLGEPLIPATWIKDGVLTTLAYIASFAADIGLAPANDPPTSIRMSGGTTSIEEMIGSCERGIYVNRFARVQDPSPYGVLEGVTEGGCFLVRHGKIERAIKNLAFQESPWFAFNRLLAIGTPERTAFGYSPWLGTWPIAPTIVPPMMVQDFNFTAMGDAV